MVGNPVPVLLPVRNVGAGAAFDIRAEIEFRDVAGDPSPAGQPNQISPFSYGALGADQATVLQGSYASSLASPLLSLRITLTYQDVFGAVYTSSATYVDKDRGFRDVDYNPPAELDPTPTTM